jgi:multiple sugar transport system permease protein
VASQDGTAGRSRPTRRRRPSVRRLLLYVVAIAAAVVVIAPVFWMLSTSLKTDADAFAIPPDLIPPQWNWQNYVEVFSKVPFARYLFNSMFIATSVTLLSLLFHSMAAYSLARLHYPGRQIVFVLILSTMMIPFTAILIPLFMVVKTLGWLDTYQALIVPAIFSAYGIFLLRQFYLSIPSELEDAARVDGAGYLQVYWHVILPLSRPILAALGVFIFLYNWNSFLWPLAVTQSPDLRVVQIGVQQFTGEFLTRWNLLMAASTVAALPTLILFLVLQRRLVEGIKLSGLKG